MYIKLGIVHNDIGSVYSWNVPNRIELTKIKETVDLNVVIKGKLWYLLRISNPNIV